jgi:hypothetical protein
MFTIKLKTILISLALEVDPNTKMSIYSSNHIIVTKQLESIPNIYSPSTPTLM